MPSERRLSFRGRNLGPAFVLREIELAPGEACALTKAECRDGLVVVEGGVIDLVGHAALRRQFRPGAVLILRGLDRCALRNDRGRFARLSVVTRARVVASLATDTEPSHPRSELLTGRHHLEMPARDGLV